jgi:hypothetical protein
MDQTPESMGLFGAAIHSSRLPSRSIPTTTARTKRSSSQSISSSAKKRVRGWPSTRHHPGPLEVREHQDVDELGPGCRREGIEPFA